jgi:hypothetical protein
MDAAAASAVARYNRYTVVRRGETASLVSVSAKVKGKGKCLQWTGVCARMHT